MTSPNFDNIDKWLFDYVEGNLSIKQESMLENYILNHPELEVDLDMWRLSNIKASPSFVNDIEIVKKSYLINSYNLVNLIGIILILLIGPQGHFENINKVMLSESVNNVEKADNSNISSTENNQAVILTETETQHVNESSFHYASLNSPVNNLLEENSYIADVSDENNSETRITQVNPVINQGSDALTLSKLPYNFDLTLNYSNSDRQIRNESESLAKDENFLSIKFKAKKLINKIDKLLSKNVALSNYRDHYYLIPGISSLDANLSSTGSVSQSRFQTVSRMRWFNTNQQKLTQQLSFDAYARPIRSGIGAQVNYESYADGTIQDWNAALIVSPKIALSRNILLEPVAKLKMGNKLLDINKVENNTMAIFNSSSPQMFSYDTSQNIGRKLWYRDVDLGITLNTNMFYIGIQASNVLAHSEDIYQNNQNETYRAPTSFSMFAGTQYVSRNEKLSFHPYVYFRTINKENDYYAGFSLDLDKVFVGASYDFNNQYTGSLGLSLDRFALIIQSTNSFNQYLNQNLYTHQLTLRFNSDVSKKTRRYITF